MPITIICALAQNRAIGFQNKLLYHLRKDLQRFKALTTQHTIIMGRRTFESFPKGALPNRRNIVLTRNAQWSAPGAETFASLDEALAACGSDEQIFVIGGESVYAAALPLADTLCLTHVEDTPAQADAFFPEIDLSQWQKVNEESHAADEQNDCAYSFVDYKRI